MSENPPIALVVDDEPMVRMTAADILEDAGYSVLEAADAEEAFFYLEEYPTLSLLFTDIQMPEIDGLTLARHVGAHRPETAVIVTSGAVVPDQAELPPSGRFVAKPYSPDLIRETLLELRGSRLQ